MNNSGINPKISKPGGILTLLIFTITLRRFKKFLLAF